MAMGNFNSCKKEVDKKYWSMETTEKNWPLKTKKKSKLTEYLAWNKQLTTIFQTVELQTFHHSFHQGPDLLVLTDILIDRGHKTHLTDRFLFSDHM